jgi:hypothetical protein
VSTLLRCRVLLQAMASEQGTECARGRLGSIADRPSKALELEPNDPEVSTIPV